MEKHSRNEPAEQNMSEMASQILRALRRRRWWILIPAAALPLVAAAAVMLLPDRYESEATLVVLQPRVAQRYVDSAATIGATDAFFAMNREILSRGPLVQIVEEFQLYPELRQKGAPPERLADALRKNIRVEAQDWNKLGDIVSFRIVYSSPNPELAQKVANRLANLFIEEDLRKRNSQAQTTTEFLGDQIETARKRLAEQEAKVRDYKIKNLEQLPQQQQALLGTLTDLRIQVQSVSAGVMRADQQKSVLKGQLGNQLGRLQEERKDLLKRYTEKHPLAIRKQEEIEAVRALIDQLNGGPPAVGVGDNAQMGQLRAQVEASVSEAEGLRREQQRLNADIARSQGLLRLTPVREQELTDILRDYELYKKDYADLLNKKLNADLSASLEQQNEGRQFRIVEPAALPTRPAGPERFKLTTAAFGAGLALGLSLAFVMETRTRVFYSEKELRSAYAVPMVIAIPSLLTPEDESHQRWRIAREWMAAAAMTAVVAASLLYVYRNG